jgi:membrane protein DedA with SNARE-associated domain
MHFFHEALALIEPYIAAYGAIALFVIIWLESFGAPVPGESAVVAASVLAARGDLPIAHVVLAVFLGATLGDSTGYVIGRFGGRRLLSRYGPSLGLTPERLEKVEALFRAKGAYIIVVARFMVVLRQLNGLIAGSLAMPWPRFVAANAVGAALWTLAWTLGPYFLTNLFVQER